MTRCHEVVNVKNPFSELWQFHPRVATDHSLEQLRRDQHLRLNGLGVSLHLIKLDATL